MKRKTTEFLGYWDAEKANLVITDDLAALHGRWLGPPLFPSPVSVECPGYLLPSLAFLGPGRFRITVEFWPEEKAE
jgi:hypothetical protein